MRSDARRDRLADEIAKLTIEVKALRAERDELPRVTELERDISRLELDKAALTEENDRKIRETEHKVGLLKTRQDQDVKHAMRMAKLEVREENLAADRERFKAEMDFQREHLQREVSRVEDILAKVLERLPNIDAALKVGIGSANGRRSRDDDLD